MRPTPFFYKSSALSTGIPPRALATWPIISLLIDFAATMKLIGLFKWLANNYIK